MKLVFENLKDSPLNILRRLGYSFDRRDERTGELSFVKRVGTDNFPRFHIFVQQTSFKRAELALHLDQKKTSYEDAIVHSGEYEEEGWVAREAEEIKKVLRA